MGRKKKTLPLVNEHRPAASRLPDKSEWVLEMRSEVEVLPSSKIVDEAGEVYESDEEELNVTPNAYSKELKQPLMKRMKISSAKNFTVTMLIVNGLPQTMIAQIMNLSLDQLRKTYEFELQHGKAAVNANVAGMLYKKCMEGNVPAIKFYLETQADYTTADKRDPKEGHKDNLTEIERRQIMANMLMEDPRMLAVLKQKMKDVKTESKNPKQLN